MDKWYLILFESSVSLILFYLVFYFGLRKETFFKTNRFFLLFSVFFSLIIPLLNINLTKKPSNNILINNVLETITVSSYYEQSFIEKIANFRWLEIIYILGIITFSLIFVTRLISIAGITKKTSRKNNCYPKNVKIIKGNIAPFSFFNSIYVNDKKHKQEQISKIIAHEQVHVNQKHTYDNILYELLIIFFWFNPIVYKYRKSAKENQEYLADEGVIKSGISNINYQNLLYEQAGGLQSLNLANSFNYSLTKNRLIMLTKIKSSRKAKVRLLYALPIVAALIITFACKNEKDEVIIGQKTAIKNSEKAEKPFLKVEKMPEFPGGDIAIREFIAENISYPEKAEEKNIQGVVYVSFVVDKNGYVKNAKVLKGVHEILDNEALRVVSLIPKWTPGEHNGEKVGVQFTLPINFSLK